MVDVQSKVAFNTLPGWPQATWPQGTAWTEKKPLSLRVREEPKTLSVCSAGKGMIFSPETGVIFKHWATFVAWVPACRKGCQCILAPRKARLHLWVTGVWDIYVVPGEGPGCWAGRRTWGAQGDWPAGTGALLLGEPAECQPWPEVTFSTALTACKIKFRVVTSSDTGYPWQPWVPSRL